MATFNSFSDILPDPVNKITDAGNSDSSGTAGPGFASVRFRSVHNNQLSRTISGRGVSRTGGAHYWEIDINYHPMLRSDFDPIDAFLSSRGGRLKPFYVVLPQHSKPKDSVFATFATNNVISVAGLHNAGKSTLLVDSFSNISGSARPGDIFTISDPTNVNHKKVYKITRVETNALYQSGTAQPATNQLRLHIVPPLERNTSDNSVVNFINPKFRVVPKGDVQEYDLNTDNLYSFSLQLEELQP